MKSLQEKISELTVRSIRGIIPTKDQDFTRSLVIQFYRNEHKLSTKQMYWVDRLLERKR